MLADGLWYVECVGYPAIPRQCGRVRRSDNITADSRLRTLQDVNRAQWGVYPPIAVIAWSQGAIASDLLWREDILPENGYLHYLKTILSDLQLRVIRLEHLAYPMGMTRRDYPGPGKEDVKSPVAVMGKEDLRPRRKQ